MYRSVDIPRQDIDYEEDRYESGEQYPENSNVAVSFSSYHHNYNDDENINNGKLKWKFFSSLKSLIIVLI